MRIPLVADRISVAFPHEHLYHIHPDPIRRNLDICFVTVGDAEQGYFDLMSRASFLYGLPNTQQDDSLEPLPETIESTLRLAPKKDRIKLIQSTCANPAALAAKIYLGDYDHLLVGETLRLDPKEERVISVPPTYTNPTRLAAKRYQESKPQQDLQTEIALGSFLMTAGIVLGLIVLTIIALTAIVFTGGAVAAIPLGGAIAAAMIKGGAAALAIYWGVKKITQKENGNTVESTPISNPIEKDRLAKTPNTTNISENRYAKFHISEGNSPKNTHRSQENTGQFSFET